MELKLKHILYFLIGCYIFSLGMFSAHIYHRVSLNQSFKQSLTELNKLSQEKETLLVMLKKDFQSEPSVAAHIEALIQKNPQYQYETIFTLNSEQIMLQEFYGNFLNSLGKYYPNSASLAQALLLLETKIIEQRNKTISDLSLLL